MSLYPLLTTWSSTSELIHVYTSTLWITLISSELDSHVLNIIMGLCCLVALHQRRVMHYARLAHCTLLPIFLKLGTGYLLPEAMYSYMQGCALLKANSCVQSCCSFSLCCTYAVLPWKEHGCIMEDLFDFSESVHYSGYFQAETWVVWLSLQFCFIKQQTQSLSSISSDDSSNCAPSSTRFRCNQSLFTDPHCELKAPSNSISLDFLDELELHFS